MSLIYRPKDNTNKQFGYFLTKKKEYINETIGISVLIDRLIQHFEIKHLTGFGCCRAQQRQSCTVDGVTYEDGSSWPSLDGCQQCRCSSGLTFCVRVSFCRDLGQCGVIVTLPGACCPVCFGKKIPSLFSFEVTRKETLCFPNCFCC